MEVNLETKWVVGVELLYVAVWLVVEHMPAKFGMTSKVAAYCVPMNVL